MSCMSEAGSADDTGIFYGFIHGTEDIGCSSVCGAGCIAAREIVRRDWCVSCREGLRR